MASTRTSERGEGKIGCTLTLLVLVAAVAAALKVVPVFYTDNSLATTAEEVASQAGLYPIPALEAKVRTKAADLGITEAMEDGAIEIKTAGSREIGTCTVKLNYTRTVDFFGFYKMNIATSKTITNTYRDVR